MKPMLASDWLESKIKFPRIVEPKVDGVRGLNMLGQFTGRSLKPFGNRYVSSRYSHSALLGLDGEIAAGPENHPDLCRMTTSALNKHQGEPYILWWIFDYVTVENRDKPYLHRFDELLPRRLEEIRVQAPELWHHLRPMPFKIVTSMEGLLEYEAECLALGFEGICIRDPGGKHKQGRSTPTEGGLLRIKRFVDFEFMPHTIIEGEENQNDAQINELGHTFRTTHQENMVANGMVGAMIGSVIGDVKDLDGNMLFEDGQDVRVGAGCLTHDQRRHYFENPDELTSQISKGKFFPKGIKDKPRFPTWQSFRQSADIS